MSVKEILREIESLASAERRQVLEQVRRLIEPEIPESFRAGMEQAKQRPDKDEEAAEWARFSAQQLARAYGDNEPEYTEADLRK